MNPNRQQKQTVSIPLVWTGVPSIDKNVNINIAFPVKSIMLKSIVAKSTDPENTPPIALIVSNLLPPNNILYGVAQQYWDNSSPLPTNNIPIFDSPHTTFYFNMPTQINGTYTFGVRDITLDRLSAAYECDMLIQLEFIE